MSAPTSPSQPNEEAALLRILDANANRASEGLRVVEDYLRFAENDGYLSRTCKQIRHELAETLAELDVEQRLACRSTTTDVGVASDAESEYDRANLRDVALANLHRVAEALRALEENSKIKSVALARRFESLRYRIYTLEKSIGHVARSRRILRRAGLYVLVDERFGFGRDFENRIRELVEAGVDAIQLRIKGAADRDVISAASALRAATQQSDTLLIVNDRPDIARISGADGVHLGQEEMNVAQARLIVGPDMLIGLSTHTLEQARQGVLAGADYIGIGPVFTSKTKTFRQFVGLDLVEQVTSEIPIATFAIGGITLDRLTYLLEVGVSRIAVSHAIWAAEDAGRAARQFRTKLDASPRLSKT